MFCNAQDTPDKQLENTPLFIFQGDSGGPMMCKDKLAGVVSFGPNSECGNEHMPGVYTNISIFAPVIDQTFRTKIQRQVGVTYLRLSTFKELSKLQQTISVEETYTKGLAMPFKDFRIHPHDDEHEAKCNKSSLLCDDDDNSSQNTICNSVWILLLLMLAVCSSLKYNLQSL